MYFMHVWSCLCALPQVSRPFTPNNEVGPVGPEEVALGSCHGYGGPWGAMGARVHDLVETIDNNVFFMG